MLDVDDSKIGHAVMIRAEGYQVCHVIGAAFRSRRDVVNVNRMIEGANHAAVPVAHPCLLHEVFRLSTSPAAIVDAAEQRGMVLGLAEPITEHVVPPGDLTWEALYARATVSAGSGDAILPSGRGGQALPFDVARARTGDARLRRPVVERIAAYSARARLFAATIVAIVSSSVLVMVDIAALQAGISGLANCFATTACTQDRFFHSANLSSRIFYRLGSRGEHAT